MQSLTKDSRVIPLLLWMAVGVVMAIGLGRPPIERTQEARVLVTAREMLGQPFHDWMLPRLSGDLRMQKPPLAYWLAAGGFEIGGINEASGRAFAVVSAWLTLGIVYAWATAAAGDRRAGLFAAGGLAGSYLFARFARSAETDVLAGLGVALAMFAIWKALRAPSTGRLTAAECGWWHAMALGLALATLGKGGPAAFPAVYLLAMLLIARSARPLLRLLLSGAWLTYAALALPWFAYAWLNPSARDVLEFEAAVVARGGSHTGIFAMYFVWLAYACLPWTGLVVVALIRAGQAFRADPIARSLVVAVLCVLVPLCVIGQKQPHYLMSLMPVLMVLAGVEIHRWLNCTAPRERRAAVLVMAATTALLGVAGLGLIGAATLEEGSAQKWTYATGAAIAAAGAAAMVITVRRGALSGVVSLGVISPAALLLTLAFWLPALTDQEEITARELSADIRQRFGNRPLAWWEDNDSPAVTFYLGGTIPTLTQLDLNAHAPEPQMLILDLERSNRVHSAPEGYVSVYSMDRDDKRLNVYSPRVTTLEPGPARERDLR